MSLPNLSPRVQRFLGEVAGISYVDQSNAFLQLCIDEGLDEDTIFVLARTHAPTRERDQYNSGVDSHIEHALRKLRAEIDTTAAGFSRGPSYLDWTEAFDNVPADPAWCIDGLIEAGDSVSLAGPAKLGKSLFALEAAASKAAGRSFLGRELSPGPVLYLDWENRPKTVTDRLRRMGFTPADLGPAAQVFPKVMPLDTEAGAAEVVKRVEQTGAELVVIDFLQRVLSGDQSSSATLTDTISGDPARRQAAASAQAWSRTQHPDRRSSLCSRLSR